MFSCAAGHAGHSDDEMSSADVVRYRRLIAASDITDASVLRCEMTFDNAVIPQFDFVWNTSTIRVVVSTGNIRLIRYDTRCYINVRSKANMSQLNLPHATDN